MASWTRDRSEGVGATLDWRLESDAAAWGVDRKSALNAHGQIEVGGSTSIVLEWSFVSNALSDEIQYELVRAYADLERSCWSACFAVHVILPARGLLSSK